MIPTSRGLLLLALALAACSQASHAPPLAPDDVSVAAVSGTANAAVTWTVQEESGGTISSSGLYSAPSTPGTYHVVAACQADPSISALATVTVAAPPPNSFVVSPTPATVAAGGTQQFTVVPSIAVDWTIVETASADLYALPLAVSANGRYLVDRNGRPWRIQADAAWSMSANATPEQVDVYLADRKSKGFSAFYLKFAVHPGGYPSSPNAPNNYAGVGPFTIPGDLSTPNETYWRWIDTIIDKAAAQGLVVMFAFQYLGYPGTEQGWDTEIAALSETAARDYGLFLGNRYKNRPNLIWFALGDQTPAVGSTLEARALSIIDGIKAAGATQLFMAEPMGGDSNPIMDAPSFASRLDLNSYYAYGPSGNGASYSQADRAYRGVTPPKPVWPQETGFEFENNTGRFQAQSWETRRTRLWAILAGSTAGDGFGSRDMYKWVSFPACLSTPGATYSKYAFDLFATLPWWSMLPSGTGAGFAGRTLVTAGGGNYGSLDWVPSAVSSDGQWLLAYVPTTGGNTARTITIDMAALARPVRARWWDPSAGTFTYAGTGYANSGARDFTTPGQNAGGQNDWVLVLDGVGASSSCGTVNPSGLYTAPASVPAGTTCRIRAVAISTRDSADAVVNIQP